MASLDELREARRTKRAILEEKGIDPYPADAHFDITLKKLREDFEQLEENKIEISVVGRIMSVRGQGAILFTDLFDGSERFQVVFKKDTEPKYIDFDNEDGFTLFADTIDQGDFVEVSGIAFTTKRGEQSLEVKSWRILTKSIVPIPDSFYGLKDDDERYRKRYLDLLLNDDLRELFVKKSKFWRSMREFLEERGFMEVHTPTLETVATGAEADPFVTHHNDFDMDVFLRISIGELWQKRLMAGGLSKTYEIGRAYRNEGTSPDHLQEFTNMEFYWAYADYKKGMKLVQDMYQHIAQAVFETTKFEARGHTFDLAGDWPEVNYVEEIKKQTGIDVLNTDEKELQEFLKKQGSKSEAQTFERLVDSVWKQCRKNISGPVFMVGYPDFMQPLAKRDPKNKATVEQFQVLIGGAEIGKGYSELNDPEDQRQRFEHQQKLREAGDSEAMMPDYDFLEMLEQGMPPTCGFGAGERLFSFLVDKPIREVQLFPLMKPKKSQDLVISDNPTDQVITEQDLTQRVIVVVREDLESWQVGNTIGHISAFLGNHMKDQFSTAKDFITSDKNLYPRNSQYPIIIKKAKSSEQLKNLIQKARDQKLLHHGFMKEMITFNEDEPLQEVLGQQTDDEVELFGVGIFGENEEVAKMTKKFSLWDK